ncbi:m-AAA protease-interacting protein 1, mitochondrial-like isoform X2 [Colletes gigas]|nr:m-AAA protease-interacting protein 1, mitochondrial-like isoform X2 [Colletes gigas]XP_043252977.1 m-AAA protease-interacting protein 1, mitochondrial-like isoform X2 [Colletes gigas]
MNTINLNPPIRYRPFASTPNEKINLPSLMDVPKYHNPSLSLWYSQIFLRIYVPFTIDREFSLNEFNRGARQAMDIVSHALANENYEELNGLVEDKTLEILKENVSRLTPEQRNLIAVRQDWLVDPVPYTTSIKRDQDKDKDFIIEVSYVGIYIIPLNKPSDVQKNELEMFLKSFIPAGHSVACNYTFQRKYVNGVGGSWLITVVNHFTCGFNENT